MSDLGDILRAHADEAEVRFDPSRLMDGMTRIDSFRRLQRTGAIAVISLALIVGAGMWVVRDNPGGTMVEIGPADAGGGAELPAPPAGLDHEGDPDDPDEEAASDRHGDTTHDPKPADGGEAALVGLGATAELPHLGLDEIDLDALTAAPPSAPAPPAPAPPAPAAAPVSQPVEAHEPPPAPVAESQPTPPPPPALEPTPHPTPEPTPEPPPAAFTAVAQYGSCGEDPPYDNYSGTAAAGASVSVSSPTAAAPRLPMPRATGS